MIGCYFKLRKVGHTVKRSLKVSLDDFVSRLCPFPYHGTLELRIEKALNNLEKDPNPDFQSLYDAANESVKGNHLDHGHYTQAELDLSKLHLNYCRDKDTFSQKQAVRYEALLKKLPDKFYELLEAIEKGGRKGLGEYENRKSEIRKNKCIAWEDYKKQNSDEKL